MSGYPLRSVLELRRREEEAALERLADASRVRTEAETEEARRIEAVSAARQRYQLARRSDVAPVGGARATTGAEDRTAFASGAAAAEQARFIARRRDELAQAEGTLETFRSGPLTQARAAEETARKQHLDARQAREAFDKHEAKFHEAQRRATERREEDASDDIARAAKHEGGGQRQS